MLKNIDPLLNADMLFALHSMGHGDRLAIVDANFPACSHAENRYISLPGVNVSKVLESLLKHLPLDAFCESPLFIMAQDGSDQLTESAEDFISVQRSSDEADYSFQLVDRQEFYSLVKQCQLVIRTSDLRPYACLILQKGVIFDQVHVSDRIATE